MWVLVQDAYIEHINKGDETYSAEGLAAMVREIFIIGAESESVLLRWRYFRNMLVDIGGILKLKSLFEIGLLRVVQMGLASPLLPSSSAGVAIYLNWRFCRKFWAQNSFFLKSAAVLFLVSLSGF